MCELQHWGTETGGSELGGEMVLRVGMHREIARIEKEKESLLLNWKVWD